MEDGGAFLVVWSLSPCSWQKEYTRRGVEILFVRKEVKLTTVGKDNKHQFFGKEVKHIPFQPSNGWVQVSTTIVKSYHPPILPFSLGSVLLLLFLALLILVKNHLTVSFHVVVMCVVLWVLLGGRLGLHFLLITPSISALLVLVLRIVFLSWKLVHGSGAQENPLPAFFSCC